MNEETIFTAALERSTGAERNGFLDEACQGDAALRQQVEALLQSHIEAGSFLGEPVPERLAKDPAVRQRAAETEGEAPADDIGQSLGFLTPSNKPDSLGRLGHYEVQEVIGRGGMGIVLRAFDEKLHRVVAIKVMTVPLATNATARKRFTREARAAAAVSHDHVVTIHGVEDASNLPYLVMQYVSGVSLQERLDKSGPLQLHEILRIGMQAATGLAAAHAQGLVHRDIKPANILLENGVERVKITDFGLAHAVDDVRSTQPGTVIGTPEYMSPEQARGEKVDHRSDLFSLGCVLYAMCAGRPPFRAESTVAIIRRVCEDTPRPIVEINPEIPDWLVDLIDKLIAKDAGERFQSAAEVAELLGQYLAHLQQPAANPQPAAIAKPRPVRRQINANTRRRWSIAAAAVLLLCVGAGVAESTGMTNVAATVIRIVRGDGTLVVEVDDPNIQVLVDGEELVITGAGPKEVRLRPGQHELHAVKDGKPVQTQHITITRDGRQIVKVAREQSAPPSPTTRQVWADAVDFVFSGAPSPDGKYLSYVDWTSGDVAVRELATGTDRRLTNQGWPEYPGVSVFSPDGQQVAFSVLNKEGVYELRLIGLDGAGLRILYPNKEKEVQYLVPNDWSADGKFILASFFKREAGQFISQIVLVSVIDGSLRILKTLDGEIKGKLSLSPDGRYLVYAAYVQKTSRQRDIFLLATDGSGAVPLVQHAADDFVLGWTPDGKRVVFASDRTASMGIWLISVAEGKPQGAPVLVKAEMGQFHGMGFTHSGAYYYGISSGGQNVYTATLDLEQGKLLTPPVESIQRGEGTNWSPAWSPDGRYLACLSHRQGRPPVFYIRSVESNEVRELTPNLRGFNVHSLHWSPDGQALLGAGNNEEEWGALRIDVQTGAVTTLVRGDGRGVFAPILAPDGKTLFYQRNNPTRRLMRRNLESGVEQELYQTSDRARWWTLSPDGQQLAFVVGGALKLLPAAGGESRELTKMEGNISAIAWTSDGRNLLFQSASELWRIPASSGEPQATGLTMKGGLGHLRVHPDGRQVAFAARPEPDKTEVWVLENFLPPLAVSKPPVAASASAAKSK